MNETYCETCGRGGERRMAGSSLIYRHLRPADHRFVVAGPRRAEDPTQAPPASSARDLELSPVAPLPLPEQLLAASD